MSLRRRNKCVQESELDNCLLPSCFVIDFCHSLSLSFVIFSCHLSLVKFLLSLVILVMVVGHCPLSSSSAWSVDTAWHPFHVHRPLARKIFCLRCHRNFLSFNGLRTTRSSAYPAIPACSASYSTEIPDPFCFINHWNTSLRAFSLVPSPVSSHFSAAKTDVPVRVPPRFISQTKVLRQLPWKLTVYLWSCKREAGGRPVDRQGMLFSIRVLMPIPFLVLCCSV